MAIESKKEGKCHAHQTVWNLNGIILEMYLSIYKAVAIKNDCSYSFTAMNYDAIVVDSFYIFAALTVCLNKSDESI